ncbi:two-component system, OmpR family, sensor histidine kinase ChvG [Rhodovulum sp. ES.010]|uniref:sensor histidine kinase n=1 Tax=Rhodovulum sp. ES.010 TaxID=1882821 RepID=UPI000926CCE0|nr:sensor histidine kinase [Rhodovulum sp. ES.010]SIO52341.1 two-component system, OmpR family, sensor histidine kinase ChvG [Rhodovulum sp. ES.010]
MRDTKRTTDGDVVLGEDWVAPGPGLESEIRLQREGRSFVSLNRSPLARKIITFNLIAQIVLISGVLYLNPARDSLLSQRESSMMAEAELIADVFEAQMARGAPVELATADGIDVGATLAALDLAPGADVFVFDAAGSLVGRARGLASPGWPVASYEDERRITIITDFLNMIWEGLARVTGSDRAGATLGNPQERMSDQVARTSQTGAQVQTGVDARGRTSFTVTTPITQLGRTVGVVAVTSASGEIDWLVRIEREQVLQVFVVATLVSIGLSLVLASTIANPLSDLAAAAELGRDRNARKINPVRVRIPDLTARPDEIGRLSGALRGMVTALYDRIDANEQFAADVAHEIKNPLASLRSATGTLRVAKREDQRAKLLDVIDHDVRRLDRLVSDISNASRLDSELVKEEEEPFDLVRLLTSLTGHHGQEAREKGVEFISDLPPDPILINGLEARLAQVFVNLITNAISFCEAGDAVRIWARTRDSRVLVVVEDTGPGIPDQALAKVFNRFYSERPAGQFGDHSGLGLAISKQIVEAHGGVIWAENIRPTAADVTSEPLGARFVVGLPL